MASPERITPKYVYRALNDELTEISLAASEVSRLLPAGHPGLKALKHIEKTARQCGEEIQYLQRNL